MWCIIKQDAKCNYIDKERPCIMPQKMSPQELAKYFDHTLLKADATESDFAALCRDAAQYGFMMVAINPAPVAFCRNLLKESGVHVGAAIGFPLGQNTVETKVFETQNAIANGADEIDYVINITQLKAQNLAYVKDEMQRIVDVCKEKNVLSKVIFETCYLTDDEKKRLCDIALAVRPNYIKTSTGFGTNGATADDIRLMKGMVGDAIKVKASGGVRTLDAALEMIHLGVERIGSSASKEIVDAYRAKYGI